MEAEFEGVHNVRPCCGVLVLLDWAAQKSDELVWKIHGRTQEMKPRE